MLGNPRDRRTGVYYIRPFGRPVIECFLGDQGARIVEEMGPAAGFANATDQLASLFGSAVSHSLRPLVASGWSRMTYVGGAYSHALPGHAAARRDLARPFGQRLFFAGEATHVHDYSTAHGAHDTGVQTRVGWFVLKLVAEQAMGVDRAGNFALGRSPAGVDVNRTSRIAALGVAFGRTVRFRGGFWKDQSARQSRHSIAI